MSIAPSTVTDDQVTHPLSRLTAAEIDTARELMVELGVAGPATRFAYMGLDEPAKGEVLAFTPGDPVERRVRAYAIDLDDGGEHDVVVSLTARKIVRHTVLDTATDGHVPLLVEEIDRVDQILRADQRWIDALARRGLSVDDVRNIPLSAGSIGDDTERGQRIIRSIALVQRDETDLPWAHPVDGLVGYVNMGTGTATQVVDHELYPVPAERGEWNAEPHASPARTDLKPIEVTQPDGPSFTVDGDEVRWANWRFRIGFDMREGLTLHQVGWEENGTVRPILYRASLAEMTVVYADPSPERSFINYFDIGDYLFSRFSNSLELGCDCLGEIHYVDAVIADDTGTPRTIPNAICMHEEDYGVLWKHNDMFNGMNETRRNRRLVISFFPTIGNYDYGFYWYLYLDGTIELEAKATGVVFCTSQKDDEVMYGNQVAPGLDATYHQHLFAVRLDMMVDGLTNAVDEKDARQVSMGERNPHGNVFTQATTRLKTEGDAQRVTSGDAGRVWHIVNPEVRNRLGENVAYVLHPENVPTLIVDEASMQHRRSTFATKSLWVTQYDPDQRYPAGDFPNQHPGGAGLPAFVAGDRPVDGEDIVLWHNFALTHFPRPEDWPVMPVDSIGFTLKPHGFFDRNPALDIPASSSSHCATSDCAASERPDGDAGAR